MKELIEKYNVPGPRYTSYPTVPYWEEEAFTAEGWKKTLIQSFDESNEKGISLYIHLPYCESLCTFCGCHKHITKQHAVEEPYIQAVLKEWEMYLALFGNTPKVKEIHLGGGTPTFFSANHLEVLIMGILGKVDIAEEFEFGFEGHPNNTTQEHLQKLYDLGFMRVSFGVQDYDPVVQKAINRIQPFEKVEEVHKVAKEVGYTSISHDLVYGLPFQTEEKLLVSIQKTLALNPDRLSLYSYAHVPWIKGVGQRGFNEDDLPTAEEKLSMYLKAKDLLLANGYFDVGMDHFAKKDDLLYIAYENGTLHRNFMGYTTNTTQLMVGLGMSAISDSWYAFAQNEKSVKDYVQRVKDGQLPVFRGHILSAEDLMIRRHILDVMCHFETRWSPEFYKLPEFDSIMKSLVALESDGLLVMTSEGLTVTELGKQFVRNICMTFDLKLLRKKKQGQVFSKTL